MDIHRYDVAIDFSADISHAKVLRAVGYGRRVLEIGTASGSTTKLLRERDNRVTGIEIDPEGAALASRYCVRMIVGDVERLALNELLSGEEFDVVIAADVLEHLRDPGRVLVRVRRHLAPGGFVVGVIPNIAHASVRLALLGGAFPYGPIGILDNTHLRFFTRSTVEELFRDAGYMITRVERVRRELDEALIPFDRRVATPEVLSLITSDAEAFTFQFVVIATPNADDTASEAGDTSEPFDEHAALHQTIAVQAALLQQREDGLARELWQLRAELSQSRGWRLVQATRRLRTAVRRLAHR